MGAGLLYLSKFRPVMVPIPVSEIDEAGRRTGMADCFWIAPLSKTGLNYIFLDSGAGYWLTQFQLPEGSSLEFSGEFPHARLLSFVSYDEKSIPVDSLADTEIQPDIGAVNPFVVGARRDASLRSYKINVSNSIDTADQTSSSPKTDRPTNTLFVKKSGKPMAMVMRIYVPDKGFDAKGGVNLPKPVLTLADGNKIEGEDLCRKIVVKENALQETRLTPETFRALSNLSSKTTQYHPAQPEPQWEAFRNPPHVISGMFTGTKFEWIRQLLVGNRKGGAYSTPNNSYMSMFADRRFGELLVIQSKAASTPNTFNGDDVMTTGSLRYWSLCKYRSFADQSLEDNSCVYDEGVPKDKNGDYTIVVSTANDRPQNATINCGVAWVNWGTGDGVDNPFGGILLYRNMLPGPAFKKSIFDVQSPGEEISTLGEFYPKAKYMSKKDFEKIGCGKTG